MIYLWFRWFWAHLSAPLEDPAALDSLTSSPGRYRVRIGVGAFRSPLV
jgi:hypothetical protein